jgi:hypothetical protein
MTKVLQIKDKGSKCYKKNKIKDQKWNFAKKKQTKLFDPNTIVGSPRLSLFLAV